MYIWFVFEMGIPKFDTSSSMSICRFFDIFQTHPIEQHIIAYTIFGWHDSYMLLVLQCGVSLTKAYLASCAFTPTPPRSSRSLHHVVWHPKEPKDELGSGQNWNGSNLRVFSRFSVKSSGIIGDHFGKLHIIFLVHPHEFINHQNVR